MLSFIGIGGLKRSGKNTLADALTASLHRRGVASTVVAMADALRDAVTAAYGLDAEDMTTRYEELKGVDHATWNITRRQMLINIGVPATLLGGDYDHWVKRWRIEVDRARAQIYADAEEMGPNRAALVRRRLVVIVPDLRRLNECAAVHDAGGVNVLVRRRGVVWDGHETEALSHLAISNSELCYLGLDFAAHRKKWNQQLQSGTWEPEESFDSKLHMRRVFDEVVDNDGSVADLDATADSIIQSLTNEGKI